MCFSLLLFPLDRCAVADDLRQDVRLAEDQDFVGAELDLGAAVLAEDDLVALFEVERDVLAVVVAGARADGEDAAALRLLLGRVRQDDAADRRLLFIEDTRRSDGRRAAVDSCVKPPPCDTLVLTFGTLPM